MVNPISLVVLALFGSVSASVKWWTSSPDMSYKLSPQKDLSWGDASSLWNIVVDLESKFQTILGMGSSFEPSTCYNIMQMSESDRNLTVERLVSSKVGIGMNLMRLCIGTPDYTKDPWYSYDDLPAGESDPDFSKFSVEKDLDYIIPVIKLAKEKNPDLLFFASPWSPPGWMKTTGNMAGGNLLRKWFSSYALYLVKYIKAYESYGIPIFAITVQNEPGVDTSKEIDPKWHYPSCAWTAEEERDFIRDYLGPTFEKYNVSSLIWCYDHNYNVKPDPEEEDPGLPFPRTILSDKAASRFVNGVAFHGYSGEPSGMSIMHNEFPDHKIYFSEGSYLGVSGAVEIVKLLRNWASSYNAWVTILDSNLMPNNGPFDSDVTIITLDAETKRPIVNSDFYMYGQFMKFIDRGAIRIGSSDNQLLLSSLSSSSEQFAHVAFLNPSNDVVLIAVNPSNSPQTVTVHFNKKSFTALLPLNATATFKWKIEEMISDK